MTRGRKIVFSVASVVLALTLAVALLFVADLFVHHLAQDSAGLNVWGYRGPVAGPKAPGEARIVVLGGSTVFGYGCKWYEAAPALLEQEIRAAHPNRGISVINLGYNNEGAYAALPTLEDYRYLNFDAVILYEGYNDRVGDSVPNTQVYRRQSPIFRLTGYSPILPWALRQQADALLRGRGTESASTSDGKPVFRPGLAARTSAAALNAAGSIGEALDRQFPHASGPLAVAASAGDCAAPWRHYCAAILRATAYARDAGAKVLVATQPIYPAEKNWREEGGQQSSLASALHQRFGGDTGVGFVDLSRAVDLSDPALSFDTMHLNAQGNRRLAQQLKPAVEQLLWP
jgi:hypothetical protein